MSKGTSTIYMKVKKKTTQVSELNDINQSKTQMLKLNLHFVLMSTWLTEVNALISIISKSL